MAEAIKVQKDGSFNLDAGSATGQGKNRYHAPALLDFAGQKITVRFDPQALHEIVYAYTLDNRYIGEAQCIEATGFGDTEAARSFNKHRTRFIKATKLAAKAEVAMDAMEVASRLPLQPQPEVANPKVVRPLRPAPELGRHIPQPQLTDEQKQDLATFQAEFQQPQEPAAQIIRNDDPRARYKRWVNLDRRLREGSQLSAADQKFWAMYQKGDEFRFMSEFSADFESFDETVEA
ncbi:Mu transposase C-terminal domain-containing protein [Methylophaga thiooxydans]